MLNIFKNTNRQELTKNETNLLVKQFNGLNIQVYGTYDEPLFKAKDIGDLLEIKDVLSTVKDFDNDEKGVGYYPTPGGIQQMVMLKEQGLYKILMISRKPIAKKFQKWVFNVIKSNDIEIGIEELNVKECDSDDQENDDFHNWLEENIQYKYNSLLQLGEVCELYLNTIKVHSSVSSKYKKEMEKYIKKKYKQVKSEYGVVKINDITYNGWKHLCIKN
jgi:hypothetical protein